MATQPSHPADIAQLLGARVVRAVEHVLGEQITVQEAVIREAAPEHGADYQSNAAMALAKRFGQPPRQLAEQLVASLDVEDLCEAPAIAGPGFINMRLKDSWISERLGQLYADPRLGVAPTDSPARVVVDYSSPNVAKEMHVGHLRSTIIGDALVRLLRFRGDEVIAQNHLGDWGTPFGMLIEHAVDEGLVQATGDAAHGDGARGDGPRGDGAGAAGAAGAGAHAIDDLNSFYRQANSRFQADPAFAQRARDRVVALQDGDAGTLALWQTLVQESEAHFRDAYARLGVLLTDADIAGESTYQDQLADVASELQQRGLAVDSDGALCVFPDGFTGRDGEPVPLIVRKSDGAYGYDTTDLAALRHRTRDLGATEVLYVVGAPQRLHLEMVFAVAAEMGWLGDGKQAFHVAFGSVLGEDHKMLRTRSGDPVRLSELLAEAEDRAAAVLAQRGMEADAALARAIGIGAVKYADLASDREKDYVFSWERMLAFEGNTSVYLQYANARALSVLRRAADEAGVDTGIAGGAGAGAPAFDLREGAERDLALALLRLPAAIETTLADFRPHKLCTYLHGLAVSYSGFYEACPVLGAEDGLRQSRLGLCELASRALVLGLDQLGIEAPQRLSPPPARA